MKFNISFLLALVFLLEACASFKSKLTQRGDGTEAIKNAIIDFSNTNRLYQKDSVFSVQLDDPLHEMILEKLDNRNDRWIEGKPYEGLIAITISANYNKMPLTDTSRVGNHGVSIPTRYIEQDGKLFYWIDDDYAFTEEVLTVFNKHNLLVEKNDLDGIIEMYDFSIDDNQKGVHYYFCENDLLNYKKVITEKAIGYYSVPKLDCE